VLRVMSANTTVCIDVPAGLERLDSKGDDISEPIISENAWKNADNSCGLRHFCARPLRHHNVWLALGTRRA
jgi:hypothetical protein